MYDFPGYAILGVKDLMCGHSTVHYLRTSGVFSSVEVGVNEGGHQVQVFIRNKREWSKLKDLMSAVRGPKV